MRKGIEEAELARKVAPLDRQRDANLRRQADPTDIGGVVTVWYRTVANRLVAAALGIQPGIADDLPSLLSSLATEIAWPGVPPPPAYASPPLPADQAVAVWARVWQVREDADLRVLLWWDAVGQFHGATELRPRTGNSQPLLPMAELTALLDRVAVQPVSSESPHGLLVAGNRAMQAEDYTTARAQYTRAVRDLPHHPAAYHNLALALAHLGDWEAASNAMQQALELESKNPQLVLEYIALETDAGIEAAQQGDLERAAAHFLHILQLQPDEPTALANLGNLRLREQRLPEARAIFHRLLRYHPTHPTAEKIRLALEEMGEQ